MYPKKARPCADVNNEMQIKGANGALFLPRSPPPSAFSSPLPSLLARACRLLAHIVCSAVPDVRLDVLVVHQHLRGLVVVKAVAALVSLLLLSAPPPVVACGVKNCRCYCRHRYRRLPSQW